MNESCSNKPETTGPPETGKVVKILSPTQVVLGFGEEQGVRVGTRYRIIIPIDVSDPDNASITLGIINLAKGLVEVTQVFPNLCIARPPEQRIRTQKPSPLSLTIPAYEEKVIRNDLNISEGDIALTEEDREIHVGDPVILVKE